MLINEIKLSKKHTLFFENYNTVKVDRDKGKRGRVTAIMIKKKLIIYKLY